MIKCFIETGEVQIMYVTLQNFLLSGFSVHGFIKRAEENIIKPVEDQKVESDRKATISIAACH